MMMMLSTNMSLLALLLLALLKETFADALESV
jgi:hypothetical protein